MNNLKIAVVCSSNQNRSMEAHGLLSKKGFNVKSFGTGTHVKLPGPAPDKPNVYDFQTTYEQMYKDLEDKDINLYTQNGILHMLDRNRRIKPRPERFQSSKDKFDIVITCEERVYDQVVEDFESREQETGQSVHVLNIDIQDNHEEATLGAFQILNFCSLIRECTDLENDIDELLQDFELKENRDILHTVCFY
ncbi:RNA polymerase II subunit A C-terminal domain phosphatase SSU72-like [Saccoglossus kowalevskii]|uniref:RNA polymerase II subunit A C-terminal domain phosphatase SSU72 n=1 Tax=Saccoglossus kowalevskii TaxID=10224 RepID=A0ABM0GU28_SACKO|nr:PREDICTED: RNA polymerase II subunit A C-terminal domain phosphatase SSU72-like [Saccoglossus kowalevskii]